MMKKKQIIIRIMFITIVIGAAFIGYEKVLNHAMDAVAITTSQTVTLHNQEMAKTFSTELESLSDELNTKVESINTENVKLQEVIKEQSKQMESMSEAIKKLGVTFQ